MITHARTFRDTSAPNYLESRDYTSDFRAFSIYIGLKGISLLDDAFATELEDFLAYCKSREVDWEINRSQVLSSGKVEAATTAKESAASKLEVPTTDSTADVSAAPEAKLPQSMEVTESTVITAASFAEWITTNPIPFKDSTSQTYLGSSTYADDFIAFLKYINVKGISTISDTYREEASHFAAYCRQREEDWQIGKTVELSSSLKEREETNALYPAEDLLSATEPTAVTFIEWVATNANPASFQDATAQIYLTSTDYQADFEAFLRYIKARRISITDNAYTAEIDAFTAYRQQREKAWETNRQLALDTDKDLQTQPATIKEVLPTPSITVSVAEWMTANPIPFVDTKAQAYSASTDYKTDFEAFLIYVTLRGISISDNHYRPHNR